MTQTSKTMTYKSAYTKLEALAEEVESLDLSDLDKLVKITEKASQYAKVCNERIQTAREKLNDLGTK